MSHDEAPAIKLCSNKKEQEMYENYAGERELQWVPASLMSDIVAINEMH